MRHHRIPLKAAIFAALAAIVTFAGCASESPLRRHCELEWQLRHRMPHWSPADWNAWEAELAAALDKPTPESPLFAESAAEADEKPVAGETKKAAADAD